MPLVTQQSNQHIGSLAPSRAGWKDYFLLTKPGVTSLVVITVFPTMIMSAQGIPPIGTVLAALFGTFLASSSAAIFNHLVEQDKDRKMTRTRGRPLATGKLQTFPAAMLALVSGIVSLVVLYRFTTPLAAWTALAANLFYVLVYTVYLKPRTTENIVIGGAAGAVGPLIGAASVAGSFSLEAWTLFLIIFLWTPPHFWALAIKYKDDYQKAGIPMLPGVKGIEETKRQIYFYSVLLLPAVVSLYLMGAAGWIYLIPSTLATGYFVYLAYRLRHEAAETWAMPLFHYSCSYLFFIFGSLTLDQILLFG